MMNSHSALEENISVSTIRLPKTLIVCKKPYLGIFGIMEVIFVYIAKKKKKIVETSRSFTDLELNNRSTEQQKKKSSFPINSIL